jgi:DNA-directed RNA polymerase specialized sigma24 family protein
MKDWNQFHVEYRRQIGGMATKMLRRWSAPEAVEPADLEQEIMLAAWRAWSTWKPGRGGMSRQAFAICTGRLAAQRWLHVQREALRRDGRAPSRFALAHTSLGDDVVLDRAVPAGQDLAVEFRELLRDALRECNGSQRLALETLVGKEK